MFHKLKISNLRQPIADATTVTFDVPNRLYDAFNYYPGQHLIIKFQVNGKEARRSYSLNSSPFRDEPLEITVKKVKGGLVSNYVNGQLKIGDELEVMVPQGRFYADIKKEEYKTYYLFAAGSGITPILSILKSVLYEAVESRIHLLYGNTHQDSIIFKEELDALEQAFPNRLQVVHTLSNPKVWSTWEQWKGRKGRIDEAAVEWFINQHPPIAQTTSYFICGPGAMNTGIRKALMGLDVPRELIHIEQFGGTKADDNHTIDSVDNASLEVHINGQTHSLKIPKGKTILQVMKDANTQAPYSCESGVCGTCACTLVSGTVEMKSNMALEDKDLKKGLILSCQSLATSESIVIRF